MIHRDNIVAIISQKFRVCLVRAVASARGCHMVNKRNVFLRNYKRVFQERYK